MSIKSKPSFKNKNLSANFKLNILYIIEEIIPNKIIVFTKFVIFLILFIPNKIFTDIHQLKSEINFFQAKPPIT